MRGDPLEPMTPWYRGFKGTIERVAEDKYKCSGIIKKIDSTTVEITELPIKKWTQDYKEMLEEWIAGTEKVPATVKVCAIFEYVVSHISETLRTIMITGLQRVSYRFDCTLRHHHVRGRSEEGGRGRFRKTL
jgi:hypothetical protein